MQGEYIAPLRAVAIYSPCLPIHKAQQRELEALCLRKIQCLLLLHIGAYMSMPCSGLCLKNLDIIYSMSCMKRHEDWKLFAPRDFLSRCSLRDTGMALLGMVEVDYAVLPELAEMEDFYLQCHQSPKRTILVGCNRFV